jgi:hypothetical protein
VKGARTVDGAQPIGEGGPDPPAPLRRRDNRLRSPCEKREAARKLLVRLTRHLASKTFLPFRHS